LAEEHWFTTSHWTLTEERFQAALAGLNKSQCWYAPGGGDVDPQLYGEENLYSGGNFERDKREVELVKEILNQQIPLLGICRGHQVINVAAGGTLFQDMGINLGIKDHTHINVKTCGEGFISFLGKVLPANTYHHQAVKTLAPGWKVAALSPDNIIESIVSNDFPNVISVQWHPEWLADNLEQLSAFIEYLDGRRVVDDSEES